jgi:hypothetical protein
MSTRRKLIITLALVVAVVAAATLLFIRERSSISSAESQPVTAGNTPANNERPPDARTNAPTTRRVRGERSARALRMGAALDAGRLPDPLPPPRGRFDRQAAELARIFIAGGDDAVAALHTAMTLAGVAIRYPDGTVSTPSRPQGLVMHWWEVAALATLEGRGYGVTLGHLADTVRMAAPGVPLPLEQWTSDALAAALQANDDSLRFWSRFIVELGYLADEPYDLITPGDHRNARFNPVQVSLLLSRLAGEMAAKARPAQARHAPSGAWPRLLGFVVAPVHAQGPCAAGDEMGLVNDWTAIAATTLFGGTAAQVSENFGLVLQVVNTLNAILKFVLTYSFLETDIEMDAEELIRTKDRDAGDYRVLTATVHIDSGKAEYLNCLRKIMNLSGIDLSIPQSGPVPDARLTWSMPQGRAIVHRDPSGWWVEDALAYFDAHDGNDPSPAKQFTDGDGKNSIDLVGAPQEYDLTRIKTTEINKDASVQVNVQVKGRLSRKDDGSISGTGAASAATDVLSTALAYLTGDPVGGTVGVVSETILRTSWFASDPFRFTIKDWQPCGQLWTGVITYSSTRQEMSSGVGANSKSSQREEWKYTATIHAKAAGERVSEGSVNASASYDSARFSTGLRGCYYVNRSEKRLDGSVSEPTRVRVSSDGKRYTVGYTNPVVPAKGQFRATAEIAGQCNNPYNRNSRQDEAAEDDLSPGLPLSINGEIDPENPNVIRGSQSITRPAGSGTASAQVVWSFVRCQG